MKSRKPKYRDRLKDPYIGLFSHVSTLSDINFFGHFRLGYSAMQVEDWKTGARAYREYCSFDSEVRVIHSLNREVTS